MQLSLKRKLGFTILRIEAFEGFKVIRVQLRDQLTSKYN